MIAEHKTATPPEEALQIMVAIDSEVEVYSQREGVSLQDFVKAAVAEKLTYLKNVEWANSRQPMTEERRKRAIELLNRIGSDEVQPGDELPEGYIPLARR